MLTLVTGLVDAVSILTLGRVFVANMTGNVVFVGFALAGAPGFALGASLFALAGFLVGAGVGGRLADRSGRERARLLRTAVAAEFVLLGLALVVLAVSDPRSHALARDVVAALAAIAMGMQNAVVRSLAVPDLTTTVLTMTLTGIAADIRARGPVLTRRLSAVATMLVGAIVGALLVLQVGAAAALGLAVALVAVVAATTVGLTRRPAPWQLSS